MLPHRMPTCVACPRAIALSPAERDPLGRSESGDADVEEQEFDDLEIDEVAIDEAALPALDTDDAEANLHEPGYDDLIDRGWLDRVADDGPEDEPACVEDIGLTIELDNPIEEDEGAQVVDLDVGSLFTSLPSEGTELDLETGLLHDRGDGAELSALRDMLLPEDDEEQDDREVGDDDRFPVFDDEQRAFRLPPDDDPELGPDDLT